MRKSFITLTIGCAAALNTFAPAVDANGWGPLSDWCLPEGCFEVGAAAIYEQTCVLNFTYADALYPATASNGVSLFNHALHDVNPKAYWGFKVWLGWNECNGCHFVYGLYKRLHSYRDSKCANLTGASFANISQLGTVSVPALGANPVIFARQRTKYDTAYLQLGRNLLCQCGSRFYGYASGRYVGAEIMRCISVPTFVATRERTRFDGGGLELGLGGESPQFCGFSFVGNVGTMALFGNRSDTFEVNQLTATTPFVGLASHNFPKRRITKCVPGIDFLAGIRYTYDLQACGCCVRLIGEVGWEMDYFWNILANRPDNTPIEADLPFFGNTTQFADPKNFGTSGLYLALSARF